MNRRFRHRFHLGTREGGGSTIEFAFILPILLTIILGMIDLSFLLSNQINLTHICREAAGALSRGSSFNETFAAILTADEALDLDGGDGRIILTEIRDDGSGHPMITRQETRGGLSEGSQFGTLPGGQDEAPATIPNGMSLPAGMSLWGVELFSKYEHLGGTFVFEELDNTVLKARAAF